MTRPGGRRLARRCPTRWRRRASVCGAVGCRPSASRAVLRLLRGEDLELVSRALGVMAPELSAWRGPSSPPARRR
jgi:hypothetical protein